MTATGTIAQAMAFGAGAPSRPEQMWLQADWHYIKTEVKRLQARIAKATMEGRRGKVRVHILGQCEHLFWANVNSDSEGT